MARMAEPYGAVATVPGRTSAARAGLGTGPGRRSRRAVRLAFEHQVADRHVAGVHLHDERRQRAVGLRCLGPGRHADDLGHRLGHVRVGVERQLDDRDLLDRLRLHAADAVHELEPELERADQQPFHLAGVVAAVVGEHVDLRLVDRGEDIDAHAVQGERPPPTRVTTSIIMVMGCRSAKTIGFIGRLPILPGVAGGGDESGQRRYAGLWRTW